MLLSCVYPPSELQDVIEELLVIGVHEPPDGLARFVAKDDLVGAVEFTEAIDELLGGAANKHVLAVGQEV